MVNDDLRAACAEHGLRYPPEPASSPWSTIGGNAATDAGGMYCVKYGVTLDYVLGLEVVNGLGKVVSLGRRTAKGAAGYDVAGLMVGAEDTLALITVRPRPARPQEVAGYFSSVVAAGEAVIAVTASGVIPSALELVNRHSLAAVDTWQRMGLSADADVVLLGRVDAPGVEGDKELGSAVLGVHHA
nr:FAD-binding protein [Streptomyces atratus]